jgi:hypothetical protein
MTQWNGKQPVQMEMDIVMDAFKDHGSIEGQCRDLEKMSFPADQPTSHKPPPIITVTSDLEIPHIGPTVEWLLDDVKWGDNVIVRSTGERMRQDATLIFVRNSPFDKIQLSAAARKRSIVKE